MSSTGDRKLWAHLVGMPPIFLQSVHGKGRVQVCVKYGGERRQKKSRQGRMRFLNWLHRAFGAMQRDSDISFSEERI